MRAAGSDIVLDAVGIAFAAGDRRGRVLAVDDVTRRIPAGGLVSVVGPPGCGKSTLLSVVAGLRAAATGRVEIGGRTVAGPRHDVAVVCAEDAAPSWRTVADDVRSGPRTAGLPEAESARRARAAIGLAGLTGLERRPVAGLPVETRQRVALARALAARPSVLLVDDPFAALDGPARLRLAAGVRHIWREAGSTVLLTTRDIAAAILAARQVWVMSDRPGRILDVVDVDLPPVRDAGVTATPRFHELRDRIQKTMPGAPSGEGWARAR